VLVAKLSRDGYVAQVLIGTRTQTLIITGRRLTPSELLAAYCAWRGPAFRLAVSQCAGAGEPWRRTRVSRGSGGAAHLRWAAPVAGLASRSG